jgi:hypothetical protein
LVADWRGEKRGPGGGARRVKDRALRTRKEIRGAWLKREADICMQEARPLVGREHARVPVVYRGACDRSFSSSSRRASPPPSRQAAPLRLCVRLPSVVETALPLHHSPPPNLTPNKGGSEGEGVVRPITRKSFYFYKTFFKQKHMLNRPSVMGLFRRV